MDTRLLIDKLARTPQSTIFILALGLTVYRLVVYPYLLRVAPHKRTFPYRVARFFNEVADSLVYAAVLIFFLVRPFLFQTFVIPTGSMVQTLLVNDYIGVNKAIYRYTEPQRFDIAVFKPPKRAALDPGQIDANGEINVDFIKRLIGLPGDVIEIKQNVLYINGQRTDQPWVHYTKQISPSEFQTLSTEEAAALTKASFKLVKRRGEIIPLNYTELDVNAERGMDIYGKLVYSVASEYAVADRAEGEALKNSAAQAIPPGKYLFMGDNRYGSFDGRGWGLVDRADIVGRADFIWLPFKRIRSTRGL